LSSPYTPTKHGIDAAWAPRPREVNDKIKFLHVGGEAYRKGLPETIKAFRTAFPDADKAGVQLTAKRGRGGDGFNIVRNGIVPINGPMPFQELLDLHYSHHIFVYPSWGEGFGFNPFQAMATGMPAIVTDGWAPYDRFIDPKLKVSTRLTDSPWPNVHPGKMFKPDFDELVDKMRYAVDNYDELHARAQSVAPQIHQDYNWDTVTRRAFEGLESRLK